MNTVVHTRQSDILGRCVSIDLEVDPEKKRIFAFAAVTQDPEAPKLVVKEKNSGIEADLTKLGSFCQGFDHVIGHNILKHDLPYLKDVSPNFVTLENAPIDTLRLNPLAFPQNPYHRLVKHYQDGRLQTGHVNDPEFDARLVFELLENQINAFAKLNEKSPDVLTAYHYLCSRDPHCAGFDRLFAFIRNAAKPGRDEAHAAIRSLLKSAACTSMVEKTLERLDDTDLSWPMAYALSWIFVAGGGLGYAALGACAVPRRFAHRSGSAR